MILKEREREKNWAGRRKNKEIRVFLRKRVLERKYFCSVSLLSLFLFIFLVEGGFFATWTLIALCLLDV